MSKRIPSNDKAGRTTDEYLMAQCPRCGKRYRVSASQEGKKARCRCGQIFEISGIFELNEPAGGHSERSSHPQARPHPVQQQPVRVDLPRGKPWLHRAYLLGIGLSLLGLYLPLLSLLVLSVLVANQTETYTTTIAIITLGVLGGFLASVSGAALWAKGKGRSIQWAWSGVGWVIGLLVIYLLSDQAQASRLANGDCQALQQRDTMENAYRELPWYRRHHFQAVSLYLGCFGWVIIFLFITPLLAHFRTSFGSGPGAEQQLIGRLLIIPLLLLLLINSPFMLLIPTITLLTGGISLPPRRRDTGLRSWGPWRLIACVSILLMMTALIIQGARDLYPDPAASRPPQSADAVAHAVVAAVHQRWSQQVRSERERGMTKQLEWVEIRGYDPETGAWLGMLGTSGHLGPKRRAFVFELDDGEVDLRISADASIHDRYTADGSFIKTRSRLNLKASNR